MNIQITNDKIENIIWSHIIISIRSEYLEAYNFMEIIHILLEYLIS